MRIILLFFCFFQEYQNHGIRKKFQEVYKLNIEIERNWLVQNIVYKIDIK